MISRRCSVKFSGIKMTPDEVVQYLEELDGFPVAVVQCVQKDADGAIIVTLEHERYVDVLLDLGVVKIRGAPTYISPADARKEFIKVYFLPHEVENQAIAEEFKNFGIIYSIRRDVLIKHPDILSGTRTVVMTLRRGLPSFMRIADFDIKIWYRGQQQTCRVCHRVGHMARNCSEIRCYVCKNYGHLASDCGKVQECDHRGNQGHVEQRCPARNDESEETLMGQARNDESEETLMGQARNDEPEETLKGQADRPQEKPAQGENNNDSSMVGDDEGDVSVSSDLPSYIGEDDVDLVCTSTDEVVLEEVLEEGQSWQTVERSKCKTRSQSPVGTSPKRAKGPPP